MTVLVLLCGSLRAAQAQGAWVDHQGSLTGDFTYQYVSHDATVISPDLELPDRPTKNHTVTLSATYVPIEKLAIEGSLPLTMSKYEGAVPHVPPGAWDDGKFHTTLTDLRLGARYQVLDEPYVAISPYLAVSIPMMDYEVIGFASGGARHLKQVHLGASFGRTLDPYVPNLYLAGGYEFSLGEKYDKTPETKAIKQRRSDIDLQIGYLFLDGDLGVNLGANMRFQHGGINFEDFGTLSQELVLNHDPLLDEDFMFVGGGVSYAVTPKISVTAIARFFLRGYNTNNQNLFGLNLSWNVL